MNRIAVALGASALLASCAAAVPQPQSGGASGGSFVRGMTSFKPVTDEYQVAWTLAAVPVEPQTVAAGEGRVLFGAPLVPERLFVPEEPVRSRDGELLLQDGTQLLLMEWPSLMACSVPRGPRAETAPESSVCLLDENGDGSLDSYFDGGDGLGGMWFVLNKRLPADRKPLASASLRDVEPSTLAREPAFVMRVSDWQDGGRRLHVSSEVGRAMFTILCRPLSLPAQDVACLAPPILVSQPTGEGAARTVRVRGTGQPANVRFRIAYGMVSGAEVATMQVTFDGDAPAASR